MFRAPTRSLFLIALVPFLCVDVARAEGPKRYARIAVDGARVLNLADDKGIAIASPAKNSLVAVFDELESGWCSIEIPGGFPVWVHGKLLKPTEVENVYEVTRNAVNLRPAPSNDVTSFPLPQRLQSGNRVQGIELMDPKLALEENWVRIWSPPGVRAWIRTPLLEPLGDSEDGMALWNEAQKNAPRVDVPASLKVEGAETQAQTELEAARELLQSERTKATPDYPTVRRALEAVLAKQPTGPIAIETRNQLLLLEALERAALLENELDQERARRTDKALEEQKKVWEAAKKKDPLGDAFLTRGTLTREHGLDGKPHYWLTFGGEQVAEVLCTSGRYALDLFTGCDVGVQGFEVDGSDPSSLLRIELTKLELIGRR